ncbi:MAG: AEC family transporter [Candidatus Thorarchaeota archaeon]|jgi:predicted permease
MQVVDLAVNLSSFYVSIAIGYAIAKISGQGEEVNKHLIALLVNLLVPILVIQSLLTSSLETLVEIPMVLFAALIVHLSGTLFMYVRLRRSSIDNPRKGVLLLCSTFQNALFIPLPLAILFIGDQAVPFVIMFSMTQMLLLVTLGSVIGSRYSESGADWRMMARQWLKFPPFVAALLAFFLMILGVSLPLEVVSFLSINGTVTTYLSLVTVGLGIGTRFSKVDIIGGFEVAAVRQLLVPLLIGFLLLFLGLSDLATKVVIIEALMPPAVFTVVFAGGLKLNTESAATAVTVGTILLLPLVPLLPILLG